MKKILFVIPARGGSKGIPGKNIKRMGGVPLICRSIDIARKFVGDKDICVTTDSDEIIEVVKQHGMEVPFKRPDYLATDTASSYDVLIHALDFYKEKGIEYDWMVLLQPTTPFRKEEDLRKMLNMMNDSLDMVVSVKPASANPYYDIFEEDSNGHLVISKGDGKITRRQEAPLCYEYNGAVYVINVESLKAMHMNDFKKIRFHEMTEIHSVDLDTMLDWKYAELLIQEGLV